MTDQAAPSRPPEEDEYFDFDPNSLGQAIADAPEAGFASVNFGRLSVLPYIIWWGPDKDPKTGKSMKHLRVMKGSDRANKDKGESTEIKLVVDIQEFNPALNFKYERRVRVNTSSRRQLSDWSEIVLPSLENVLGKDWMLRARERPYVSVEDVENINRKHGESGKTFGVPKLLTVYNNAAECAAARDAFFSRASSQDAELNAAVEQVRGLLVAIEDQEEVRKLLTQPPFDKFDAETLFTLATVE